jgi:hypothetical protein
MRSMLTGCALNLLHCGCLKLLTSTLLMLPLLLIPVPRKLCIAARHTTNDALDSIGAAIGCSFWQCILLTCRPFDLLLQPSSCHGNHQPCLLTSVWFCHGNKSASLRNISLSCCLLKLPVDR